MPGDWRGPGTTVINVNEQKMLDSYEKLMDQVYLMYHFHPSNIPHIDLTAAEKAEMVEYDAMGKGLAEILKKTKGGRKVVRLITDSKRSNGLKRKTYDAPARYHAPDEGLVSNWTVVLVFLGMAVLLALGIYNMIY